MFQDLKELLSIFHTQRVRYSWPLANTIQIDAFGLLNPVHSSCGWIQDPGRVGFQQEPCESCQTRRLRHGCSDSAERSASCNQIRAMVYNWPHTAWCAPCCFPHVARSSPQRGAAWDHLCPQDYDSLAKKFPAPRHPIQYNTNPTPLS